MDQTKLLQAQISFALDVARLIALAAAKGYYITFGEAYRTKEQAEIYAKEGIGIIDSLHCKRLAVDLNLFDKQGKYLTEPEQYKVLGDLWKGLNPANHWGGDWKKADADHFEREVPK